MGKAERQPCRGEKAVFQKENHSFIQNFLRFVKHTADAGKNPAKKGGRETYLSSRQATPGSSLPSMNSREAPLDTAEAPPAADEARACRGSGTIGGPGRDRESSCRDGG